MALARSDLNQPLSVLEQLCRCQAHPLRRGDGRCFLDAAGGNPVAEALLFKFSKTAEREGEGLAHWPSDGQSMMPGHGRGLAVDTTALIARGLARRGNATLARDAIG